MNQPFSHSKTLNTNYLSRNWFATQKDLLKEETPKEEPVFEVDVNSQTYKLLKVKQDYGNVNIKQREFIFSFVLMFRKIKLYGARENRRSCYN